MIDTLYFAGKSLTDTLEILERYGRKATILAGGTDLVPRINRYQLRPEVLIYIGNMGLDYIREGNGRLLIGAALPMATIAHSSKVVRKAPALAEAASLAAIPAIRSVATIGGNIANASPSADLAPPLLVLDAELTIKSSKGERIVPIASFFKGPGKSLLKPGELITEISIPVLKGKGVFLKLGRRKAMTHSVVNVAVRLEMNRGICNDVRIAVGGVAPTPLRCLQAEEMLRGERIDPELISLTADAAMAASSPIDDRRSSAWYRREAGAVLVARAIAAAAGLDFDREVTAL